MASSSSSRHGFPTFSSSATGFPYILAEDAATMFRASPDIRREGNSNRRAEGGRGVGRQDWQRVVWEAMRTCRLNSANYGNLNVEDFQCRYLVVDDIWIPLGESLLIRQFRPLWNVVIDGFGNHAPGSGRYNQQRSPWDVLHPGRGWAERLARCTKSEAELVEKINKHYPQRG